MGNYIDYYYNDNSTIECFDEISNNLQYIKQPNDNFGYSHIYDTMHIRPRSIHYDENYGLDIVRLKY